jgi:hypothetical protein
MKVIIPFESLVDEPSILNEPEITVRNKQGDKVRILCTDGSIPDFPVVGIVEHDDPDDNYPESYTREGHYTTDGIDDRDLIVEVDNDAVTEKMGVDPLKAAMFAAAMFGDTKQYSPEELEFISLLSLMIVAE